MLNRSSATLVIFTATACNTLLNEASEGTVGATAMSSSGAADGTSTTTYHPTSTSTPEETGADSGAASTTGPGSSGTNTTADASTVTGLATGTTDTSDTGTSGDAPQQQIVFATQQVWPGSALGGLDGADAKCQTAATAAGLLKPPNTIYRAWLSQRDGKNNINIDAKDRLPNFDGPYILVDGSPVAMNWRALTDGVLDNAIRRTEEGHLIMNDPIPVWTNTSPSGVHIGSPDCASWNGDGDEAPVGDATKTDHKWTFSTSLDCGSPAHLYCIGIK